MMGRQLWPFRIGRPKAPELDPACRSCPEDTTPGSEYCREHRGDDPDYEPTDLELASNGVNTYPSDPGDSPSYNDYPSCIVDEARFSAMAANLFPATKGTTK